MRLCRTTGGRWKTAHHRFALQFVGVLIEKIIFVFLAELDDLGKRFLRVFTRSCERTRRAGDSKNGLPQIMFMGLLTWGIHGAIGKEA